jgi:hypothetical protein
MDPRIREIGERLQSDDPDPVVRFRLLRDVLGVGTDDPAYRSARRSLDRSRWVRQLAEEQHADGSWGRFHSGDASIRRAVPTTEFAVARGLAVGLDSRHRVFRKTVRYLLELLAGERDFPDTPERNDRWETSVSLFASSTLASLSPEAEEIDEVWEQWAAICGRTFASGDYDPDAEARAHREITGASVAGTYLVLANRYAVALLGARVWNLPGETARRYADWLWNRPAGIGYLSVPLSPPGLRATPGVVDRWFTSVGLLAPYSSSRLDGTIEWLWSHRDQDGLWDLGPRWVKSASLPLSEDWRRKGRRRQDHTTRVLALLRSCGERTG